MPNRVDERLNQLLREAEDIEKLNTGSGDSDPTFVKWRKRAEAAVSEKFGSDHHLTQELRELAFTYNPILWTENTVITPQDNMGSFRSAFTTAVGILQAAREANPVALQPSGSSGTVINVEAHGGSASANADATVTVHISTDQLRQLIATDKALSPEEKGKAIAAIPDEEEGLTLEKVDTLLGIATKSAPLLKHVLGWVLANAEHLPFA